ncbi:hypothetical protein C8A00DRAFT_15504 [Chaetomidium leptoderma]|uniref:BRCT domain-containing protein n=1 Tax=Chaetomidium leptoderma TaxID=669021 RepID=A0AAN6VL18_9PEZI|nr:hypothetical protein C8A00DRAFT_15504 [Chaetomidium leptoderma]
MDAQSPPKRMTRARAAAKTSEPAARSTRVVTAAAKAKTARSTTTSASTTTTTRTALKRKSPSDDDEDDLEMQPAKRITTAAANPTRGRGRPRKVAVEEPAPEPAPQPEPAPVTTVRTRGRPKKTVDPVAPEPAKATRTTRTKKTAAEETEVAAEPVKKATRGRPAISTSTTTSTAAKSLAKPAVKKTVKFEEPEKENIAPATTAPKKSSTKAAAGAPATGLRGKPVRKAASAATTRAARSTRAAANTADPSEKVEKPMPLSPKKVNQLTINRVESDDELGMDDKVPVRRFKKAPIKANLGGSKSSSTARAAPLPAGENDENAIEAGRAETEVNFMLATPAKRLPASPWKGSIASPAKRVEGLLVAPVTQIDSQKSQVVAKMGLLQSPAKRQPLNMYPLGADGISGSSISPVKLSFLSSPAKRPPISPIKPLPRHIEEEAPLYQSPAPKPTLLASPMPSGPPSNLDDEVDALTDDDVIPESPTRLSFPGRLSAVLPRHADPALTPPMLAVSEQTPPVEVHESPAEESAEGADDLEGLGEAMVLDNHFVESPALNSASTTPPSAPPKSANPMFGLRDKDLYPYDHEADSESDGDSPVRRGRFTSAFSALPTTPCPASARTSKLMQSAGRSTAKKGRFDDNLGFTPLAQQLSGWAAGPSPLKTGIHSTSPLNGLTVAGGEEQLARPVPEAAPTPIEAAQNTFFEDEMHVRPEPMETEEDAASEAEEDAATEVEDNDDIVLEDVSFTEEDMELAAEANEMSLVEKEPVDHDDSVSEASQEYADENAIPIDPALVAGNGFRAPAVPPVTPQRVLRREVHTVAKVPLKPADDSTPRPKRVTRSSSASRIPVTRPTERLTRNATVISYSPTKGGDVISVEDQRGERAESVPPVTPQKSDIWSTIGTPARTPRRDLNPALLRGAVVFVDVHTSEGADASSIFVELLTQMGARCVKTWSWNPNSESGADSRVGITHIVYKDGGKRTLEKVRESGGVVQCVGVSWVLDCERENQWLDEAPYYIDTSLVPRGGARRRKSMEPRAIANLNGMLVPSPVGRNNSRSSQTAPNTPANNRRASALWIRSPEKSLDDDADYEGSDNSDHEDEETEWASLTPVPKTPAPEAIARFAADISPGPISPSSLGSVDTEDPLAHDDDKDNDKEARSRQEMLLRTCPPKRTAFVELGDGILSKEKNDRVLMRLMAARRKSLQFAPKVGSPLARTWKAWN